MKKYRLTNEEGEKLVLLELANSMCVVECNIERLKCILEESGYHTRRYNNKYGKAWKRIRDKYQKQHQQCELCSSCATEVHHIVPLVEGGANHRPENLLSVCHECHIKIHSGLISKETILKIKGEK